MRVTAEMVKELRELTGAGVMDCKEALTAAECDMQKAQDLLREQGLDKATRKAERETTQGVIESYVHMAKIGALVELNCETDFVARTPQFRELAHDLAMQVVAGRPLYVSPENIPSDVLEQEKAKYLEELESAKKPAELVEKIIQGKLAKFYQEICILEQPYIKDPEKTVRQLISESIATIGENIVLSRFARLELAEE